jgi:hypothetical protein
MPLFPKARFDIVADDKTKKGTDSANKNLDRLKKNISLAGVASVAAAGIAGLGAITAAGLRLGDELAKTADKLGLSTEGLAGLRNAARLTGVETGKLDMGLQRMTRRIAEAAQGSGEAQGALKELGLDARHLAEQSPDEQFRSIAEAMKGVSSQSDRVRLGFKLFDSEGVDLIRTLDLGTDGLDAAAREAEKFGTALSRVRAREIEHAGDALGRVRTASEGLSMQLAASLAPSIAQAANELADFIAQIPEGVRALRFFAEHLGIVEANIRSLTEAELLARTASLTERIAELQQVIDKTRGRNIFGGTTFAFGRDLNEELAEAKRRLDAVNARLAEFRRERARASDPVQEISLASLPKRRPEVNEAFTAALFRRRAAIEATQQAEQEKRDQESAQKRAEREAERRAAELESVRVHLLTREELEVEAFKRREQIILDNLEAGAERDALLLDNARQRAQYLIELERHKQEEINRAVESGVHTREQFEKASFKSQVKGVLGTLESITAGVATHDKRLFALNKAAAIGNAIVNTAQGITKAWSLGPILGPPMAAIVAAAGAAQISAIRGASFGGGSTPSVVGSTPTLEGQPVPPAAPATSQSSRSVLEVHIHGSVVARDDLKKVMGDVFDADDVIIHKNSRQAAEIRSG